MKKYYSYSSAFGLLETVIAIGILALFITSIIALTTISSKNVITSKHRLQAANLAREGLEAVTQIRDTAKLKGISWSDITADADGTKCFAINGSVTQVQQLTTPCEGNSIRMAPGLQTITDQGGNVNYERTITVNVLSSDLLKLNSHVVWKENGSNKDVSLTTYLANW